MGTGLHCDGLASSALVDTSPLIRHPTPASSFPTNNTKVLLTTIKHSPCSVLPCPCWDVTCNGPALSAPRPLALRRPPCHSHTLLPHTLPHLRWDVTCNGPALAAPRPLALRRLPCHSHALFPHTFPTLTLGRRLWGSCLLQPASRTVPATLPGLHPPSPHSPPPHFPNTHIGTSPVGVLSPAAGFLAPYPPPGVAPRA